MIKNTSMMTETGCVRKVNQDAIYAEVKGSVGIFVVADGMGGHSRGEYASNTIITNVASWWEKLNKEVGNGVLQAVAESCKKIIERTNSELYHEFSAANQIGGSTVVILIIWGNDYVVEWVGDSRAYIAKDNMMDALTIDDVWENLPEVKANYTKEQIESNRNKGKLACAVGAKEYIEVNMANGTLNKKDTFVLCSDGLYKYCDEKKINKVVCQYQFLKKADGISRQLQKEIIRNGAKDNYSVIVCKTERE